MKRTISFMGVLMLGVIFVGLTTSQAQAYEYPYGYGYQYPAPKTPNAGKILLQVQDRGQAWYVNPADQRRYYLGRPSDAFEVMKKLGIGITNANLRKFPVAAFNYYGLPDTDRDGLYDDFEKVYGTDWTNPDTDYDGYTDLAELRNGYNPFGAGFAGYDMAFAKANKGKIFLQVENGGAAWYINPADSKAYYLGRPGDAFNVMRFLGVGATNDTINRIPRGDQYQAYPVCGAYGQAACYNPTQPTYYPTQPAPSYPSQTSNRYYVRLFNVDNVAYAIINGNKTYTASYGADNLIDVTDYIHSGNNTIQFKLYNDTAGYTWGFQIKRNDQVLFSEIAGLVGVTGANGNDAKHTFQDVYNKTVILNESGVSSINGFQQPVPVAPTPSHWYLRVFNADDRGLAVINNKYSLNTSFDQDTGFVDISNYLLTSGNNTIDLRSYNDGGAYAWGFQLKKDSTMIFDDVAGDSGTYGAHGNEYSREYQYSYNKTLTINTNGVVSVRDNR
ncbi:MAG: hypothetical protein Q8P11_03785 [bacterium]|nr:hypothetical protein [bacterium]